MVKPYPFHKKWLEVQAYYYLHYVHVCDDHLPNLKSTVLVLKSSGVLCT